MKFLLIEDDEKIAAAVSRGLQAEGFIVQIAHDGDVGYWRATEGTYDLIILDIMLPGRNGFRVCADLRAADIRTPILMLTAKDGDLDEAEALDTGADDYLVKPFSFPVLVARVRALLRRSSGRSGDIAQIAGLALDSSARRVWSNDVEMLLTTREFEVLEYLARRPGRVVSKLEILDGVWTDDFDGDPNIVEVYIGRIRRKLARVGSSASVITTIRGAGYRLEGG